MIESLLARGEGKTLEFKENCRSLDRIVRTAVAFANTAGGNIVIEITNPGLLPFGLTLEAALAGVSRLRNRVIGRVFRELGLIEQWGSGLGRIRATCRDAGLAEPRFEELGANFRVTLFGERVMAPARPAWQAVMLALLARQKQVTTREAAKLWKVSDRSARARLRRTVEDGILVEVGKGPRDPFRGYVLRENRNG